jgi:6-pyruvoyltetrahydropterin/6-carboxytetrahydropterin synthase
MFEVSVERTFAAAHQLRDYKGKCENLHGHNYKVRVTVQAEELDAAGLVVDFVEIKRLMDQIIERLDHTYLNDIPPFDRLNPSAENIAKLFFDELDRGLKAAAMANSPRLAAVKVWETETSTATYRP